MPGRRGQPRPDKHRALGLSRELIDLPGSMSPADLHGFVNGVAGLLVANRGAGTSAPNDLDPATDFRFFTISNRLARVARSRAGEPLRSLPPDEIRSRLYDHLPPSKEENVIAQVIGTTVIRKTGLYVVRLESDVLTAENQAAFDALPEIFELDESVDLGAPSAGDISLGRFVGGADENATQALTGLSAALIGHSVALGAIPNPREPVPPAQ